MLVANIMKKDAVVSTSNKIRKTILRRHLQQQQQQQQENGWLYVPSVVATTTTTSCATTNSTLITKQLIKQQQYRYFHSKNSLRVTPTNNLNRIDSERYCTRRQLSSAVSDNNRESFSSVSGNTIDDDVDTKIHGIYRNNPLFQFNSTQLGLLHDNNNTTGTTDSSSFLTIPIINSIRQLPEVDTV